MQFSAFSPARRTLNHQAGLLVKTLTDTVLVIAAVQTRALAVYRHKVPSHSHFLIFESADEGIRSKFKDLFEKVTFAGIPKSTDMNVLDRVNRLVGYPYTPDDTELVYEKGIWVVLPSKLFDEEFDQARVS